MISSLRSRLCDGQRAGESEGRRIVIFSACDDDYYHQESHALIQHTGNDTSALIKTYIHKSVEFTSNGFKAP